MKEAISAAANTSRAIATGELGEISKYVDTKQKNVAELQYAIIISFDFLDDERVGFRCQAGAFASTILELERGLNS